MPFPWLHADAAERLGTAQAATPVTTIVDSHLIVTSRRHSVNATTKILTFEDGVLATYDGELLTADRLEVHLAQNEQKAIASGKVVLTDPDGTIQASDLEFAWLPENRYAKANNVVFQMVGANLHARSAFLTPNAWNFTDFSFTTDRERPPLYLVSGRTLTIFPGKYARIDKPTLFFFGQHILTWKAQRFSLNPQASGVHIPTLEYHDGTVGLTWQTGILIGPSASLEWHFDAYRGEYPGLGAQVTQSFIPAAKSLRPIVPRSELSQRFDFGYFESVLVSSAKDEDTYLRLPRSAVTVLSNFNADATGRTSPNESFSTPGAVGYESSGDHGELSYLSESRLETIRRLGAPVITRFDLEDSIGLPSLHLTKNLSTTSRIDEALMQSDRTFGWSRLSGGLVYDANRSLSLAAGAMVGLEGGRPDFDIDPLVYKNGFMMRADYSLGPRKLAFLSRYDSRLGWFDQEVYVSQVMGSFNAYFVYQEYPGNLHFGVALRIDEFLNVLKRRDFQRNPANPPPQH